MPEEKNIIGVPEDVAEKLKVADAEKLREVPVSPAPKAELWIDGNAEKQAEKIDTRYVSSYERKLKEVQAAASASVQAAASDETAVKFDADSIRHMENADGRVQKLLDLARVKGVAHAVQVAETIDAYTLDKTHDRLADELSDELRKRGLLPDTGE